MKFARIIDGQVVEVRQFPQDSAERLPLQPPTNLTKGITAEVIADLEKRVGEARPWDFIPAEMKPLASVTKPAATSDNVVEQVGWKIDEDKVEPVYEVRQKVSTDSGISERLKAVEDDLKSVKELTAEAPIKQPIKI